MSDSSKHILVTGATGFVGAHIVNELLSRGHKVRGVARSKAKAEQMIQDRPQYAGSLEFVYINDLATAGVFDDAVKGVDGVINVASPIPGPDAKDLEKEIILPAVNGAKSMLEAAKKEPKVKRIVFTSSMAAVMLPDRGLNPGYTYTSDDWNPVTYEEGKNSNFLVAYQASKTFAEKAAWDVIKNDNPHYDLVTFCFPFVFGPLVHPVTKTDDINVSNKGIWAVASGANPLPVCPSPTWIDVRDLAYAHVEALFRPGVSNRRFLICAPGKFTYQMVADILREEFDWAKEVVTRGDPGAAPPETCEMDWETTAKALGIKFRGFKECILETVTQFKNIYEQELVTGACTGYLADF